MRDWQSQAHVKHYCRYHLAFLVTAVAFTLYFFFSSWLEERKLIQYHGEIYRRYRERVPSLIPLPRRYMSRKQAGELLGS